MARGRLAWALAGLLWCTAAGADEALLPAVEACIAGQFSGAEPVNRDLPLALAERCPDLAARLDAAAVPLDPPLGEQPTLALLLDLRAALRSLEPAPAPRHAPDPAAVPALLAQILEAEQAAAAQASWWSRLLDWLIAKLEPEPGQQPSWLLRWLKEYTLPEWAADAFLKATVVGLLALALAVVLNEVRAARPFGGRRRGASARGVSDPEASQPREQPSWEDILRLPPGRRAAALLRWAIALLARRALLSEVRSRTNREYLQALAERAPALTPPFAELVDGADTGLYGRRGLDEAQGERLQAAARALRDAVETPG